MALAELAPARAGRASTGLQLALLSALAFGSSGSLGKGMLEGGWSPGAVVTARVAGGALVLAVPAALALRGRWHLLRRGAPLVLAYGALAVAGCQLAYFSAIESLPVAVALLVEYSGTLLVVGWMWARHGHRPTAATALGVALALAGLLLVLDVGVGTPLDPAGVVWAGAAAVGLAAYFVLSADDGAGLPPIVLAGGGMAVGAVALAVAGLLGAVDLTASTADVALLGRAVPWVVPLAGLVLVAAALGYGAGVAATRRLGSTVASFVGLTEVLFAVLLAWLLLGELPRPVQLAGGVLVVAGIVAVRAGELLRPRGALTRGGALTSRGARPS